MKKTTLAELIAVVMIALVALFSGCIEEEALEPTPEIPSETFAVEKLNVSNVTTTWNLSFLFSSREEALAEFEAIKLRSEYINETYRPKFDNLTGTALLNYLEDEKNILKALDVLWIYAYAQHSLNVNDEFFETFLSDIQDLATEHDTTTSFVTIKLTSISKAEWDKIFDDEPGLDKYKPYLESSYVRFVDHRPQNESHAAFLATISNKRMKLETNALKKEAIEIYLRILGNFPDFEDRDKVHFFLAHEYRELGQTDDMIQQYRAIIKTYKSSPYAAERCPYHLRRIEFYNAEKDEILVFLTNHMKLGASTVPAIYKDRWQIELFFKALKQNLKIKTFVGTSPNAVKIQIWTALIAMLILRFLQLRSKYSWSLSNLIALLRMNLFTHRSLWAWLNEPFEVLPAPYQSEQLPLPLR